MHTATDRTAPAPGIHDFDFLAGRWRVRHHKLTTRLAGADDWVDFDGTVEAWPLMDGAANVDDNVLEAPDGTYRAVTLRSYDRESGQWSIRWLDDRFPLAPLEPPMRGFFVDGVGTFFADEVFQGQPVRVRFVWSEITATSARWEQAFSTDAGATWEVNWTMRFTRIGGPCASSA
jgi:hypothetical protein